MALEVRVKPVEKVLFQSAIVALGTFRCRANHPLYRDSGPCSNHTFVFPRTATAIHHLDGPRFVGSPNAVSLYNQAQRYSRQPIDPLDASDWFVLDDETLRTAVELFDPSVRDRPDRPFRHPFTEIDAGTYLEQRRLFDAVMTTELDPLTVDEQALRIFERVLASAYLRRPRVPAAVDEIEQIKGFIASQPFANHSLARLASLVDLSPFELCRAFKGTTGTTITRYKHALRLRLALEPLGQHDPDLTDLAFELGYSSHSHFTAAFRRHFGTTPSNYRGGALTGEPLHRRKEN